MTTFLLSPFDDLGALQPLRLGQSLPLPQRPPRTKPRRSRGPARRHNQPRGRRSARSISTARRQRAPSKSDCRQSGRRSLSPRSIWSCRTELAIRCRLRSCSLSWDIQLLTISSAQRISPRKKRPSSIYCGGRPLPLDR